MQFIKLYILVLKCDYIAKNNITNNKLVIQAIKDLTYVCLRYKKLNPVNRNLIDLMTVEKKMALLLDLVGLSHISIDIYFKNRLLKRAKKLCKKTKTPG